MNYDDSSWEKYTSEIPFPEYEVFWVRQKFVITDAPSKHSCTLRYAHDDEAKIYVNGKLIHDCGSGCSKYYDMTISGSDLIQGTNIIAAYVNDSGGGDQYICLDFHADDEASIVKDYSVGKYVNLGLSSKTLWANTNVGAETETDFGEYYAWAETTTKENYSQSNYKYATGKEASDATLKRFFSVLVQDISE